MTGSSVVICIVEDAGMSRDWYDVMGCGGLGPEDVDVSGILKLPLIGGAVMVSSWK